MNTKTPDFGCNPEYKATQPRSPQSAKNVVEFTDRPVHMLVDPDVSVPVVRVGSELNRMLVREMMEWRVFTKTWPAQTLNISEYRKSRK